MARIRTIKPEFFTSEDIVGMTPLARLFYVSLWCESDREGRLEWKPGTFKMRYLPGDACSIQDLAGELVKNGLIILYTVGGKQYAEIPTFTEHQIINNRESMSTIPARPDDATLTRESVVKAEGKEGKEGKGREGNVSEPSPDVPQHLEDEHIDRRENRRSTPDDEKCARWLFGRILANNATAKSPNFDSWADDVRLIRERDGKAHAEICELFQWAQVDSFWCANILSPAKLREKWDQLMMQRSRGRGAPNAKAPPLDLAAAQRAANDEAKRRLGISSNDNSERIIDASE